MSAVLTDKNVPPPPQESPGLWTLAWRRMKNDRVGMISLAVVVLFLAMMLASKAGIIASDWYKEKGVSYANPSFLAGAENLEGTLFARRLRNGPARLGDVDAGADADMHPPLDLERDQRLPDRRTRNAHPFRKLALGGQAVADAQAVGGDQAADVGDDLVDGGQGAVTPLTGRLAHHRNHGRAMPRMHPPWQVLSLLLDQIVSQPPPSRQYGRESRGLTGPGPTIEIA